MYSSNASLRGSKGAHPVSRDSHTNNEQFAARVCHLTRPGRHGRDSSFASVSYCVPVHAPLGRSTDDCTNSVQTITLLEPTSCVPTSLKPARTSPKASILSPPNPLPPSTERLNSPSDSCSRREKRKSNTSLRESNKRRHATSQVVKLTSCSP